MLLIQHVYFNYVQGWKDFKMYYLFNGHDTVKGDFRSVQILCFVIRSFQLRGDFTHSIVQAKKWGWRAQKCFSPGNSDLCGLLAEENGEAPTLVKVALQSSNDQVLLERIPELRIHWFDLQGCSKQKDRQKRPILMVSFTNPHGFYHYLHEHKGSPDWCLHARPLCWLSCLFPAGISPLRCPTSSSKWRAQNESHHHLPQPVSPLFDGLRASFLDESPMLKRALHLVFLKFFIFEQRVPYFHFALGPQNYVASSVSPSGVRPLPLLRKPKPRDFIPDPPFISFLYLIMLFHAQGFIPSKGSPYLKCLNAFFSSFKELISTCPLIINQVHLYQKYLLMPEPDTNAPSWSSTSPYLSLRLWFCPCTTLSYLSSPKWLGAS